MLKSIRHSRLHTTRHAADIQYHVVWSPRLKVWRVERNGHAIGGASTHQSHMVRSAIHLAHLDHDKGHDAVVCVQQLNGGFRLEWCHGG